MSYIQGMETVIIITVLVLVVMTVLILKRSRGAAGDEIEVDEIEVDEIDEVSDHYVTDNEHLTADSPDADDRRVAGEVDEMRSHESDSTNVSYDSGSDSGSDSGGDSGGGGGDD